MSGIPINSRALLCGRICHMAQFKTEFLKLSIERQILRFGEFTLKSGRVSPYFFNAGLFDSGLALSQLCRYYVQAINAEGIQCDCLFGPAYKGIPLAAGVAVAYAEHHIDMPFAYNRKEVKDHGEGGQLVGAPLKGRVVIVDDVISAGTSVRESVDIIRAAGAEVSGVVIALDRQERGSGEHSAVQEVENTMGIPVASVATLADLLGYLQADPAFADAAKRVAEYRDAYGVDA